MSLNKNLNRESKKERNFIGLSPGVDFMKLFMTIIYRKT